MPRLAIAFAVLAGAAHLASQTLPERLDAICRGRVTSDGPGFAVLVAKGDETLLRAAYGFADVAAKRPLRVEQPFYVASIAKSLTAACVVTLAQLGKLSLDDEVTKHVPGLPEHCKGITLRHLLHHRSGLRDFYELEWVASRKPADLTTAKVLDLLRRQRAANFAPGTDFLYSNSGYLLLAEVVARASGRSLRDCAREQVFAPLSMTSSVFRDEANPEVKDVPLAYDDGAASIEPPLLCGAGGLYTTVDDLHRWLAALTGGNWQPAVVRELTTPPALRPDQRRSPQLNPYAGGLFVRRFGDEPALLTFGGFGGWNAAAFAVPGARIHVVLLANCDIDALGIARELTRTVLGQGETERPPNEAKPGFAAHRAGDGEMLFRATRRDGTTFLTTLGWKVEVVEQNGVLRTFDTATAIDARRLDDGTLELRIEGENVRRYAPIAMAKVDAKEAEALAGRWHADELDAEVTLIAEAGKLRIDASRMLLPIAPFVAIDRDTWVSDTGVQIDVERGADGGPTGCRFGTARARGFVFVRR